MYIYATKHFVADPCDEKECLTQGTCRRGDQGIWELEDGEEYCKMLPGDKTWLLRL